MDITFRMSEGTFNYRVCAVMIQDGKLLVMRDERSPYSYLPGGRVKLHEAAEQAVLREVKEELGVDAKIIRPLWLVQNFFVEDVDQERYHELCLYFLVDVSHTGLLSLGESFPWRRAGTSTSSSGWPLSDWKGSTSIRCFSKRLSSTCRTPWS